MIVLVRILGVTLTVQLGVPVSIVIGADGNEVQLLPVFMAAGIVLVIMVVLMNVGMRMAVRV